MQLAYRYDLNRLYTQQVSKVRLWAVHEVSQWGLHVRMWMAVSQVLQRVIFLPFFPALRYTVNLQFKGMYNYKVL